MLQPTSQVYHLLPAPFAWIEIPAGKVTLINDWDDDPNIYLPKNEKHTFDVPAFAIAKYPVTNAQFSRFVDAKGYHNRLWWTDAGWKAKEQCECTQPIFWMEEGFNGPDYPVIGVSWYEALAFCRWLSGASGEKILLPTEQQWQWAAQGNDERTYPWGNEWDGNRCNNKVDGKGIGRTTPVTRYEGLGDSPFGVVDMAGNIWEWCLTAYKSGSIALDESAARVMRGGSWFSYAPTSFSALCREWSDSIDQEGNYGFRIARSLP